MSKEIQITRIASVETFKREERELHALEILRTKILYVNELDELKIKLDVELTPEECDILREVFKA